MLLIFEVKELDGKEVIREYYLLISYSGASLAEIGRKSIDFFFLFKISPSY